MREWHLQQNLERKQDEKSDIPRKDEEYDPKIYLPSNWKPPIAWDAVEQSLKAMQEELNAISLWKKHQLE